MAVRVSTENRELMQNVLHALKFSHCKQRLQAAERKANITLFEISFTLDILREMI